jgi:hypothetical protein
LRRSIKASVVLLLLLAVPCAVSAGNITYTIIDYPKMQNGWTLSGSITTNGTIGPLGVNDILSWSFMIKNGTSSYAYNSGTENVADSIGFGGQVMASATQITLPPAAGMNTNRLVFFGAGDKADLIWVQKGPTANNNVSYYEADYVVGANEQNQAWYTPTATLDGTNTTWVIASVPEPSSVYLAALGAVCCVLYSTGCRREQMMRTRNAMVKR